MNVRLIKLIRGDNNDEAPKSPISLTLRFSDRLDSLSNLARGFSSDTAVMSPREFPQKLSVIHYKLMRFSREESITWFSISLRRFLLSFKSMFERLLRVAKGDNIHSIPNADKSLVIRFSERVYSLAILATWINRDLAPSSSIELPLNLSVRFVRFRRFSRGDRIH